MTHSDELTPFSHSQRLYDAAPDHSKLIALEGQSHFTIWAKGLNPIMEASSEWFKEYIRR